MHVDGHADTARSLPPDDVRHLHLNDAQQVEEYTFYHRRLHLVLYPMDAEGHALQKLRFVYLNTLLKAQHNSHSAGLLPLAEFDARSRGEPSGPATGCPSIP